MKAEKSLPRFGTSSSIGRKFGCFLILYAERLRFKIDSKWHGVLPGAYLYEVPHHARSFSGKFDLRQLERWIGAARAQLK